MYSFLQTATGSAPCVNRSFSGHQPYLRVVVGHLGHHVERVRLLPRPARPRRNVRPRPAGTSRRRADARARQDATRPPKCHPRRTTPQNTSARLGSAEQCWHSKRARSKCSSWPFVRSTVPCRGRAWQQHYLAKYYQLLAKYLWVPYHVVAVVVGVVERADAETAELRLRDLFRGGVGARFLHP